MFETLLRKQYGLHLKEMQKSQVGAGILSNSLFVAAQCSDRQSVAELQWRIDFIECFPQWQFDLTKLTLRNTHGDYFISQFFCEEGHLSAVSIRSLSATIMGSITHPMPATAKSI